MKTSKTLLSLLAAISLVGCEDSRERNQVNPSEPGPRKEINLSCYSDRAPESEGSAQNGKLLMHNGDRAIYVVKNLKTNAVYNISLTYANDSYRSNLERVNVNIGGKDLGTFTAEDTGDWGRGWFSPRFSPKFQYTTGPSGTEIITLGVGGGDSYGVQLHNIFMESNEENPEPTSN
jgi:hypothetical protein